MKNTIENIIDIEKQINKIESLIEVSLGYSIFKSIESEEISFLIPIFESLLEIIETTRNKFDNFN